MIVIPMAGASRRFAEAGYRQPKYQLDLHGHSVFAHAVASFRSCFQTVPFLFIARGGMEIATFIRSECEMLGLGSAQVAMLDRPTAGQAETVERGVADAGIGSDVPLTIFNIDTFRPGLTLPDFTRWGQSDGYLEVFRGSGANWSYVRPAPGDEPLATETAEKVQISDLCCTGLYHFARAGDFMTALAAEREAPTAPELYVAPLYNHMIADGLRVHYSIVSIADVLFCGVPAEYEALRDGPRFAPGEKPTR